MFPETSVEETVRFAEESQIEIVNTLFCHDNRREKKIKRNVIDSVLPCESHVVCVPTGALQPDLKQYLCRDSCGSDMHVCQQYLRSIQTTFLLVV